MQDIEKIYKEYSEKRKEVCKKILTSRRCLIKIFISL